MKAIVDGIIMYEDCLKTLGDLFNLRHQMKNVVELYNWGHYEEAADIYLKPDSNIVDVIKILEPIFWTKLNNTKKSKKFLLKNESILKNSFSICVKMFVKKIHKNDKILQDYEIFKESKKENQNKDIDIEIESTKNKQNIFKNMFARKED
ncbi:uncharacterized protein LOC126894279 isoform X2 [Daktulosphaira vitifoliae]|nr:uncharacterized protein LOC126894279 isoform X2 [Daktulosphaira vitifoliae]XP_050521147.1 uncharacterized protein LOC126894279 isoform X2 [Daktulosphaira vitifoliae]